MQHFHQISWLQPWITSGLRSSLKNQASLASILLASGPFFLYPVNYSGAMKLSSSPTLPQLTGTGARRAALSRALKHSLAWGLTIIILENSGQLQHVILWGIYEPQKK